MASSDPASRYAHLHDVDSLKGPGDARPTAMQIIKDEGLIDKLSDKTFVITGTSSGIGIPTAHAIAATGARVFCTVRDVAKGKDALKDIMSSGRVEIIQMDQGSLESVRKAGKEILEKSGGKINVLINNAGIMAVPDRQLSEDGFELQFATNHLAHFLLFQILKPALLSSSTPDFESRLVNLSSSGHRAGGIRIGDYNFDKSDGEQGGYNPWAGYGQSKTANIYMANEVERRYGSKGLHGLSVMPGGIFSGLQKHVDEQTMKGFKDPARSAYIKSPEQGMLSIFSHSVHECGQAC